MGTSALLQHCKSDHKPARLLQHFLSVRRLSLSLRSGQLYILPLSGNTFGDVINADDDSYDVGEVAELYHCQYDPSPKIQQSDSLPQRTNFKQSQRLPAPDLRH